MARAPSAHDGSAFIGVASLAMRGGLVAFFVLALAGAAHAQSGPPVGAWLRYRYSQQIEDGTGAYSGYHESTTANARYEIVSVEGDVVTLHGRYSWRYSSPDRTEEDTEDRTVTFSASTRRYLQRQTDSSDYDQQDGTLLTTWAWIPPTVQTGDTVAILEHPRFEVIGEERVVIAGNPLTAIHLRGEYSEDHEDAYGVRSSRIVDEYWYHDETGMFLRERVVEESTGTIEGESFTFRLVTDITVVDASYAPNIAPPPEDLTPPPAPIPPPYDPPDYPEEDYDEPSSDRTDVLCCVVIGAPVLGFLLLLWWLIRRGRRSSAPRTTAKGERFSVETGASPKIPSGLSPTFDPFIGHMAQIASATGNKVAIAKAEDGKVLGAGFGDRDTDLATIFANDSDVCEAIRLELGLSEFFSELRHPKLASVAALNVSAPNEAYNLYETFEVMAIEAAPEDLGYDTELVSPYKPKKHRAGVVALLNAVYAVSCERWLDASIANGDLAWVAHEGDDVIGFAMATLVGTNARLHTLTVRAEHQNKGVGTALYRARLRGLFDLGATKVITECATWNVAALEIARRQGLTKIGSMYVESARDHRADRKFVRR